MLLRATDWTICTDSGGQDTRGPCLDQLTDDTSAVLFILDALDPITDVELTAAADDLVNRMDRLGTDVRAVTRLIRRTDPATAAAT